MSRLFIGVSLLGLHRPYNSMPNPWGASWGDVLSPPEYLISRAYLCTGTVDARAFYGLGALPDRQDIYTGVDSLISSRPYDAQQDWANYAWNLGEVVHRGISALDPSPIPNEKFVNHSVLGGHIVPSGHSLYPLKRGVTIYGRPFRVADRAPAGGANSIYRCQTVNTTQLGVTQNSSSTIIGSAIGSVRGLLLQTPSDLGSGANGFTTPHGTSGWSVGGTSTAVCIQFGFKNVPNGINYSTKFYRFTQNYVMYCERECTISYVLRSLTPAGFVPYGGYVLADLEAKYSDNWSFYSGGGNWNPIPGWQSIHSTHVVRRAGAQTFAISRASDSPENYVALRRIHYQVLDQLSPYAPDLRASAAVSAADALSKIKTDSNYVEALTELGGAGDLAVGPVAFGEVLARAYNRYRNTFGSLLEFIFNLTDIVTGAFLLTEFGIKPSEKDHANLWDIASGLQRQCSLLLRPDVVLRGSHKFPAVISDVKVSVKVRTKVVIPPPADATLEELMGLDARGILPTPARVWAAVKGSFIVDWGTNLSGRMETGEGYIWLCLLKARYFVHSFTISVDDLSQSSSLDDLLPEGYEALEPIYFKWYVREISRFVPSVLRPTRLDVNPPSGPSVQIFLAVLFQKAKSIFT